MHSIFKLDCCGIGEYGVTQLLQCHWQNLANLNLNLSNKIIIKVLTQLETQGASG